MALTDLLITILLQTFSEETVGKNPRFLAVRVLPGVICLSLASSVKKAFLIKPPWSRPK